MNPSPAAVLLTCSVACIPLAVTGAHAADALFGSSVITGLIGALVICMGAGLPAAYLRMSRRQRRGRQTQ